MEHAVEDCAAYGVVYPANCRRAGSSSTPLQLPTEGLVFIKRREPTGALSLFFRYGENSGDSKHAEPHFGTLCQFKSRRPDQFMFFPSSLTDACIFVDALVNFSWAGGRPRECRNEWCDHVIAVVNQKPDCSHSPQIHRVPRMLSSMNCEIVC